MRDCGRPMPLGSSSTLPCTCRDCSARYASGACSSANLQGTQFNVVSGATVQQLHALL